MAATVERPSPAVPHWLIRVIWTLHRSLYSLTRGHFGLRTPAAKRWGTLRLTTIGRRTGRTRVAIVGYLEDGSDLIAPAMNGWMDPEPSWWLNLQDNPEATVVLATGETWRVRARAADPEERERLWRRLVDLGSSAYTDANAASRSRPTQIVVLEKAAEEDRAGSIAAAEQADPTRRTAVNDQSSLWMAIATAPIFVWELSLGLYLTFKGFRRTSPLLATPGAAFV